MDEREKRQFLARYETDSLRLAIFRCWAECVARFPDGWEAVAAAVDLEDDGRNAKLALDLKMLFAGLMLIDGELCQVEKPLPGYETIAANAIAAGIVGSPSRCRQCRISVIACPCPPR